MSSDDMRRYEPLVVWVRLIICLTYSGFMAGPVRRKELCVSDPPVLCMLTAAISAPAAIAVTGILSPK